MVLIPNGLVFRAGKDTLVNILKITDEKQKSSLVPMRLTFTLLK